MLNIQLTAADNILLFFENIHGINPYEGEWDGMKMLPAGYKALTNLIVHDTQFGFLAWPSVITTYANST